MFREVEARVEAHEQRFRGWTMNLTVNVTEGFQGCSPAGTLFLLVWSPRSPLIKLVFIELCLCASSGFLVGQARYTSVAPRYLPGDMGKQARE